MKAVSAKNNKCVTGFTWPFSFCHLFSVGIGAHCVGLLIKDGEKRNTILVTVTSSGDMKMLECCMLIKLIILNNKRKLLLDKKACNFSPSLEIYEDVFCVQCRR